MEHHEAIALLESQHEFPGPFLFRAVTRPDDRASVVTAVAAVDGLVVRSIDERASRNGTYVSLRIDAEVPSADVVLAAFAVLQELDEVLQTL